MLTPPPRSLLAGLMLGLNMFITGAGATERLIDHRGPGRDGIFPARNYITDFSLGEKLIL